MKIPMQMGGVQYKSAALTADTSKSGGSWQDILTLSLEKGLWLVVGTVVFGDGSSTTEKWVRLSVEGSDPYYRSGVSTAAFGASYSQIANITSTGNVVLRTYATGNYTLARNNTMLRAVKIGDIAD